MFKFKIRYTWDAVNDLDSIFDYISDENRNAAMKMLERIETAILSLSDNPRIGTVVSIRLLHNKKRIIACLFMFAENR